MINFYIIAVATIITLLYWLIKRNYNYWSNNGILQADPKFPLGNLQGIAISKHAAEIIGELYHKYVGKAPFVGVYFFISPVALILDPELIKNIMVRDFNNFHDRGFFYNEKDDPLSAHLFSLEGTRWKNLRAKLTPTFTSGKIKMMFSTVAMISEKMSECIQTIADKNLNIDIKDIVGRYSTDVIGTTAFGIECNSLKDPNNEFRFYGKQVVNPPKIQALRLFLSSSYPNISRKLGVTFFDKKLTKFFYNLIKSNVEYRQQNNIEHNDFLQLIMNLDEKLSFNEIAAQSFLFFLAGFETSSSAMQFFLYEMALNQNVQKKVRDELESVLKRHEGKITYEAILELPYLDMCINETLRKYPSLENLLRITTSDYKVPGTNHTIEKGTRICIPVYGIQRDPKIYPNPNAFDPERFTEENIKTRHPFTFLPFGEGPRVCIGMRFGLMQTRVGLVSILKRYRIVRSPETPDYIELGVSSPVLTPKTPIMIGIESI